MTLRELIVSRVGRRLAVIGGVDAIQVEGGTLDMEVGPLLDWVQSWSAEPFDCYRTWPVPNVPPPSRGDIANGWFEEVWIFDDLLVPVYTVYNLIDHTQTCLARVYPRTPDAAYWPTEEECRAAAPEWAERLWTEMLTYVGQDCDTVPSVTPAEHWEGAKRRYGLKDNQTCRLAYVARVDPEGWHRCSLKDPLPAHVERWLRYADFLVGVRAGLSAKEAADGLYASGGVLDDAELAKWCQQTWGTAK